MVKLKLFLSWVPMLNGDHCTSAILFVGESWLGLRLARRRYTGEHLPTPLAEADGVSG